MSDPFICEQLRSRPENKELIQRFTIDREKDYSKLPDKVVGLEAYLKVCAWNDDENDLVRIYLVKDAVSQDIVAYFGIKAGMLVANMEDAVSLDEQERLLLEEGVKIFPEVLPGIEISHFAVNDDYRRKLSENGMAVKGIGKYLYPKFIYPIIMDVGQKIGVHILYLYAAGDERLVEYYTEAFGFQEMSGADHYTPLEPEYDGGCTFMFQRFYSS